MTVDHYADSNGGHGDDNDDHLLWLPDALHLLCLSVWGRWSWRQNKHAPNKYETNQVKTNEDFRWDPLPHQRGQMLNGWRLEVRSCYLCVVWRWPSVLAKHLIDQTAGVTEVPQGAALIPPTGTAFPFISPVSTPLPCYRSVLPAHAHANLHTDVLQLLSLPDLTFNHNLRLFCQWKPSFLLSFRGHVLMKI